MEETRSLARGTEKEIGPWNLAGARLPTTAMFLKYVCTSSEQKTLRLPGSSESN